MPIISKQQLGPNITLAKIITSGFFGVFSQAMFLVLKCDFLQYKPPSPKKGRKHSVDSKTPHSQTELNLSHRTVENFYEKFSSPVHNKSNKQKTFTLPTSIYDCYDLPIVSHKKLDFRSLHLHTFQSNKRKRSRGISLSKDSFDNDPD